MQGQAVEPSQVVLDLAARLDANGKEIAVAWADAIRREMPGTFYGRRPIEEIRHLNLLGLDVIKGLLLGADPLPTASQFDQWGLTSYVPLYWREGHSVDQTIEAIRLVKEILLPLAVAGLPPGSPALSEAVLRLDACLSKFEALMAGMYGTMVTRHLEEQRRSTELLLTIARTVSTSLELPDVLAEAAKGMALAVGAGHCWICLVDENGALTNSATTEGFPHHAEQHLPGARRRSVQSGEPLLACRVLREKSVIIWPDLQQDTTIDDDTRALGLRSVLGVPCAAGERVLGAALVATVDAPQEFRPEQVELALGVARVLAPAIDNARLHRRVEQTAIVEERARLAREIHDDLAQTLGAVQIRASLTEELLEQDHAAQALVSLRELQSLVSEAYGGVRDAIFSLRAMGSPGASFASALREYLADYKAYYGGEIGLEMDDKVAAALGGRTGVQAIRIVQEALTNARKHSRAGRVWVQVEPHGGGARISVKDDGLGFDLARVPQAGRLHVGLQVMRERAEKIRGTLSVESSPGAGTRVVLDLPPAGEVEGV